MPSLLDWQARKLYFVVLHNRCAQTLYKSNYAEHAASDERTARAVTGAKRGSTETEHGDEVDDQQSDEQQEKDSYPVGAENLKEIVLCPREKNGPQPAQRCSSSTEWMPLPKGHPGAGGERSGTEDARQKT